MACWHLQTLPQNVSFSVVALPIIQTSNQIHRFGSVNMNLKSQLSNWHFIKKIFCQGMHWICTVKMSAWGTPDAIDNACIQVLQLYKKTPLNYYTCMHLWAYIFVSQWSIRGPLRCLVAYVGVELWIKNYVILFLVTKIILAEHCQYENKAKLQNTPTNLQVNVGTPTHRFARHTLHVSTRNRRTYDGVTYFYASFRQAVFWHWLPGLTCQVLRLKEKLLDINIPKQQFKKQTQIVNIDVWTHPSQNFSIFGCSNS